ncbi:MAG: hypothetical protein GX552_13500 [Chloroflexi bacterium]|jgi:hypothetical protein|nr:hypothetical protein [Chloroflexota bacterium]
MSIAEKRQVLRAIWRDKMHVEPRALELVPRAVAASLEHIWQPAEMWMQELEVWPLGLLRVWRNSERGHLVFTHQASQYCPGEQPWRKRTLESVCYLSLADVCQNPRQATLAQVNLLDHLLGSDAQAGQPWLSDGAGITPPLAEVGARFVRAHALGYGLEELGVTSPHDYFAHTLWLYLSDAQRLNVLDPLVFKLYQSTLMSDAFWSAV